MKVTLNLSKLLQTKKISQDEFDRLVDLAKKIRKAMLSLLFLC